MTNKYKAVFGAVLVPDNFRKLSMPICEDRNQSNNFLYILFLIMKNLIFIFGLSCICYVLERIFSVNYYFLVLIGTIISLAMGVKLLLELLELLD